jgi:hypothetical protein
MRYNRYTAYYCVLVLQLLLLLLCYTTM